MAKSLIRMINDDKYKDVIDFLINLILVKYGGRNAYLFESSNNNLKNFGVDKLLSHSLELGFNIEKDLLSLEEHPRYWIFKGKLDKIPKTEEEIGELLGFRDPGGDYFDYKNKRLSLTIYEEKTKTNIFSQLLKGDIKDNENIDYAEETVKKFNNIMDILKLNYKFSYSLSQDDGTIKRKKELENENIRYLKKNKDEYINDFQNIFDKNHPINNLFKKIVSGNGNKKLLKKCLSLFLYFYKQFNKEQFNIQDKINKMFINLIM